MVRDSSGRPVPGHEASGVELHDDDAARRAAFRMGAHAFTLGRHIYLGPTVDTPEGPTRDEALRHELIHTAQVQYGEETGDMASEATLEREAEGHSGGDRAPVQHGADANSAHGIFFENLLSSDSPSGSDSSTSSDSSKLGMNRPIWAHLWEAVRGTWEVGPIDAYSAGLGEDAEIAGAFGAQFSDSWVENAARHGVWQARLAFKYGESSAAAIADAHEVASPDPLDSWIDQYNNAVAREIGAGAGSLEEIPDLIQGALDDGRLITSPTDPRIPENLREVVASP